MSKFRSPGAPIREVLTQVPDGIEILAEPGRVISAPSMALVCKVVGRAKRRDGWWFYLDDGVYGAQSGRLFDGMQYRMSVFTSSDELSPCVFAGPTCDSIDELGRYPEFPILNMNDVVVHPAGGLLFPRNQTVIAKRTCRHRQCAQARGGRWNHAVSIVLVLVGHGLLLENS